MPRFSPLQLQRIRRHKAKETQLRDTYEAGRIRCCTFDNLVNATIDELDSLTQLIKKVKIHRKATDRMLAANLLDNPEIVEEKEINEGLLDYLMKEYKGVRGKKLKFKYGNHDRRREIIVKENGHVFQNCFTRATENTIRELFNQIGDYNPTDKFNADEIKADLATRKPVPKSVPVPEPVDDSDIEDDLKSQEEFDNTDQDKVTALDRTQWRKKINKLWKESIKETIGMIDCDDDGNVPEEELNNLIDVYTGRTKRQTRGLNVAIGAWAVRNPVSIKKVISSIIASIIKNMDRGMD